MKTILHLIETKGPGGAETVFINLFEAFDGGDFRSVALVAHGGWVHHALERAGVSAHTCDAKGSFRFGYLRKIVRVVRREQVDLIEAHLSGASLYASLAGMITGTPVVSVFHGSVDIISVRPVACSEGGRHQPWQRSDRRGIEPLEERSARSDGPSS